jgi:hypothetical protein
MLIHDEAVTAFIKFVPNHIQTVIEAGPFQDGNGKTTAAGQADLLWCIQSDRVAGR